MAHKIDSLSYLFRSPLLDVGKTDDAILLLGMGRSGTTWVANIINHDKSYRVLFEPFFPSLVEAAKDFEYIQYMRLDDDDETLIPGARKILSGRVRSLWVDKENKGLLYRRRIIKDIRCNLMAGWLKKQAPDMPVILIIRHPLQVACSWRRLGWGKEALGSRSDFEIIISQQKLLKDFPQIKEIADHIDKDSFLDKTVFLWGAFHLVPIEQLRKNQVYYLFYEHLLTNPEDECAKLFHYLRKSYNWEKVKKSVALESRTNFLKRNISMEHDNLLGSWKTDLSTSEIRRANDILSMFGLDNVYDKDGLPDLANRFLRGVI